VISDIVSDEDVPERLQNDPALWSGCISGAMREDRFLQAFVDAGLYGAQVAAYQTEPWAVVEGIEFRSVTVVAHKGKEGPCLERHQAVVYRGPFKEVVDDDDVAGDAGLRLEAPGWAAVGRAQRQDFAVRGGHDEDLAGRLRLGEGRGAPDLAVVVVRDDEFLGLRSDGDGGAVEALHV